jgi:hypothetical protein
VAASFPHASTAIAFVNVNLIPNAGRDRDPCDPNAVRGAQLQRLRGAVRPIDQRTNAYCRRESRHRCPGPANFRREYRGHGSS